MRKMPPLPNKKTGNATRPMLELVSSKLPIPHRYNSIQRILRDTKRQYSQQKQEQFSQNNNINELNINEARRNKFLRRPFSAKQYSQQKNNLSKDSMKSKDSKESINSNKSRQRTVRQSPHYSKKMRVSMPTITAHSWVLYEMKQSKFICGRANFKRREVASLTKIMNLFTILSIIETHGLNPAKIRINVSKEATTMIGTTAQLKAGIELTLEDLFYGMMLPSGNDAAHQIAQIGGFILKQARQAQFDKNVLYNCQQLSKRVHLDDSAVGHYIQQMNQISRRLGLTRTAWANPHGLSNVNNVSSAQDLAKLCMNCMKIYKFRQIVLTRYYTCSYYYLQVEEEVQVAKKGWLKWENTNKMLWEGWSGVKTGITPNAGPCLAASLFKIVGGRQHQFLIVLLNSESMQARWKQVKALAQWILSDPYYA